MVLGIHLLLVNKPFEGLKLRKYIYYCYHEINNRSRIQIFFVQYDYSVIFNYYTLLKVFPLTTPPSNKSRFIASKIKLYEKENWVVL